MLARYKVILSYDGTQFSGFQRLSKTNEKLPHTVQGAFENALKSLDWKGETVWAAGRTDAGVHAIGQVVAFDLDWNHNDHQLLDALNTYLPLDVVGLAIEEVSPFFHPRYDAKWRKYQYHFFYHPKRQPLLERYAWRVNRYLDLEGMEKAALCFLGIHDFAPFGSPPKKGGSTVRTVYESSWHQERNVLVWTIVANAFLLHMVRRMIGLLMAVGQKQVFADSVDYYLGISLKEEIIPIKVDWYYFYRSRLSIPKVSWLAPAHGLFLTDVGYQPYQLEKAV